LESKFPALHEQIHALDECSTRRRIHPFGSHRLMKAPRFFISCGCGFFTRIRRPLQDEGEERRPVSYMTQTAVSNWAS
jgi:hypothetical protein